MALELKQAVAAVTTNDVFKRMLKANSTIDKRNFLRLLNVDVNTVTPIYFNRQKYKKDEHQNNWFLFLDEQFRLIGMLLGSQWNENHSQYEWYTRGMPTIYDKYKVVKNRINMQKVAYHILMITPEMQFPEKWTIKESKPFISKEQQLINQRKKEKEDLQWRLTEYKRNKYENLLSNERTMEMAKELVTYLASKMFEENDSQKFTELNKQAFGWYSNNVFDSLKYAGEYARDLIESIKNHEKEMKSEHYDLKWSWEINRIRESKVKIAKAYKVFGLGEV